MYAVRVSKNFKKGARDATAAAAAAAAAVVVVVVIVISICDRYL